MNIVVLINGKAGVGKDTFIKYCKENCNYSNFIFYNISTVDIYKRVARLLGCNYNKSIEDRKFISDLKIISKKYNNFPMINTLETINNIIDISSRKQVNIFFIHSREIPEIKEFFEHFSKHNKIKKCITLLIKRHVIEIDLDVEKNVESDDFIYDYSFTLNNIQDTIDHSNFFLKILKQITN